MEKAQTIKILSVGGKCKVIKRNVEISYMTTPRGNRVGYIRYMGHKYLMVIESEQEKGTWNL